MKILLCVKTWSTRSPAVKVKQTVYGYIRIKKKEGVIGFWPDLAAQGDIWEDSGICIDSIQSVHHGLYSLDPILLTHCTTLSLVDLSEV